MPSDNKLSSSRFTRRTLLQGGASHGLLSFGLLRGSSAFASALRVGERAPTATLATLDGQRISTSDLLGRVIILTFWATWCDPCREELPLLSDYAERHASKGLSVLGFALDPPEDLRTVRQAAQKFSFPVGLLANSTTSGYGRIWRIPVNFTIDRQGRLIDNGWKDKQPVWTRESLERIVTPLLGEQA